MSADKKSLSYIVGEIRKTLGVFHLAPIVENTAPDVELYAIYYETIAKAPERETWVSIHNAETREKLGQNITVEQFANQFSLMNSDGSFKASLPNYEEIYTLTEKDI